MVSQACYIVEMYHSGMEPSKCFVKKALKLVKTNENVTGVY